MKNFYNDNKDGTITIYANGGGKYGYPIFISEVRFKIVDNAVRDNWTVVKNGSLRYAVARKKVNGKNVTLWMHRLITGVQDVDGKPGAKSEVQFCSKYGYNSEDKTKLVILEQPSEEFVVDHRFVHDGLFNIDSNLYITSRNNNSKNQFGSDTYGENLEGLINVNKDLYFFLMKKQREYYSLFENIMGKFDQTDYEQINLLRIVNNPEVAHQILEQCRARAEELLLSLNDKKGPSELLRYREQLELIRIKKVAERVKHFIENPVTIDMIKTKT